VNSLSVVITLYVPLIWDIGGARFCDIYTPIRVLWLKGVTP